jgi:hypothetical protein
MFLIAALSLLALAACAPGATPTKMPTQIAAMATAAPAATNVAAEAGAVAEAPTAHQMIIKDATLVLTVRDVDQALALVTTLSADNGGYLIRSETWVEADAKHASLYLAVPSARFEAMLNQLRRMALKVEHETSSGQDVTAEYTDLRSQLTNLEATAARVRAFLDDAQTVEESLHINAELSRLEGDIERIKGQMRYYEGRSAFSTINLSLQPEPVAAILPGWNPALTIERAAEAAIRLLQLAIDAGIWLAFLAAPPLLVVALLLMALRLLWRRKVPKNA